MYPRGDFGAVVRANARGNIGAGTALSDSPAARLNRLAGLSNWQMQMIEEPFNISLRTEIAGDQFPVEKDFKRLVE